MLVWPQDISVAYRTILHAIERITVSSFKNLDAGQRRWLLATYAAVLVGFLGGILEIGFSVSIGSSLMWIAAPTGLICGVVTTILVICKRQDSMSNDKRGDEIAR